MAVLSNNDRIEGCGEFMRQLTDTCNVNKTDLRAAFNALDQYFSDNATAINTAIPQPARANLTTAQKAALGVAVLTKRYLVGA